MNQNVKNVLKSVGILAVFAFTVLVSTTFSSTYASSLFGLGSNSPQGEPPNTFLTIIKNTEPDSDDDFLFDFFDPKLGENWWGSEFTLDDDGGQDNTWPNTGTFGQFLEPNEYHYLIIREKLTDEQKLKYETTFVCTNTDGFSYEGTGTEILFGGGTLGGISKFIEPGDNWTCIFTNKLRTNPELATIQVLKDTVPNSTEPFFFGIYDISNQKTIDSFGLDDDGDVNNKFSNIHSSIVEAGRGYSVSETNVSSQYKATYKCESTTHIDPNTGQYFVYSVGGFIPQKDEIVLCTVTNTRQSEIKVTKQTEPSNTEAFDFKITAPPLSNPKNNTETFVLKDDQTKTKQLVNESGSKTYKIEEIPVTPNIYNTTFSCIFTPGVDGIQRAPISDAKIFVNVTLSPGELVHCTFINTAKPKDEEADPIIKIIKESPLDREFEFSVKYNTVRKNLYLNPFGKNTGTHSVPPNTVITVEEFEGNPAEKAKYNTNYSCSNGQRDTNKTLLTVPSLNKGDVLICTFTNILKVQPLITVIKDTVPDNSDAFNLDVFTYNSSNDELQLLNDFPLVDDGTGTQNVAEVNYRDLTPRIIKYKIVESFDPAKYYATYICKFTPAPNGQQRIDYVGSGGEVNLVLDPGEKVICTFTNKKAKAAIVVIKDTIPDSPDKFEFDITHDNGVSDNGPFLLWDDGLPGLKNYTHYDPTIQYNKTYTITEKPTPNKNYHTSYSCVFTPGSNGIQHPPIINTGKSVDVILSPEEKVVCTFTNTEVDVGYLMVVKETIPANMNAFFDMFVDNNNNPPFTLNALSNPRKIVPVTPNTPFTITEAPNSGFRTTWNCDNGQSGNGTLINFNGVTPNHTIVCTFVNTCIGFGGTACATGSGNNNQ